MSTRKENTIRLLSMIIIFAFLIAMIPALTSPTKTSAANTNPKRVGAWWWSFSDATNTSTRDRYLNALEAAGVNEIYVEAYPQLWTTSNHPQLHTFIQACMSHGMRVAVMMDDPALVTSSSSSKSYINKLYSGWVAYKNSYPSDWLYGLHFDSEPGGYTTSVLQNYINNLFNNAKTILMANGIYVEFAVNPVWNGYAGVTYNGTTGFYNILAKELAGGKGCIHFMSYRTTAAKILSRANEGKGVDACVTYGTDFTCGIETDNVESGVDVHSMTKDQVQAIVLGVLDLLDAKNANSYYGMAIHHAETYTGLSGSLSNPSHYSGGTGTTGGGGNITYTTKSNAPTTTRTTKQAVTGNMVRNVIWSGDLSTTVAVDNYVGLLDNSAVNAALRQEFAQNGYPVGDEYYEIISTGRMSGASGYAVAGFYCASTEVEIWGSDKESGTSTIGESNGTYTQKIMSSAATKAGTLLCPQLTDDLEIAFFSDADGYTDNVYLTHFEIAVYRVQQSAGTTTTTKTNKPTTTTTTKTNKPTTTTTTKTNKPTTTTKPVVVGDQVTLNISLTEEAPRYDSHTINKSYSFAKGSTGSFTITMDVYKAGDKTASELKSYITFDSNIASLVGDPAIGETINQMNAVTYTYQVPMNGNVDITGTIANPDFQAAVIDSNGSTPPVNPVTTTTTKQETSIPDEPGVYSLGDVNLDKVVDMKDVLAIRKKIAGQTVSINEITADANQDKAIDMKDVLAIRKHVANMIILGTVSIGGGTSAITPATTKPTTSTTKLPDITTTTTKTNSGNITDRPFYTYDESGEPLVTFRDPADGTEFGVWWWNVNDGENTTTRDKYLNFLQKNNVSEIYYYGYYYLDKKSSRATLHKFVSAANAKGMAVSLIYDDNDTIMSSQTGVQSICAELKTYMNEYPDDIMAGFHFDCEHETVDKFAQNLVKQFPYAAAEGIRISMDVNCEMNLKSITINSFEFNDLNGQKHTVQSYTGNIYEQITHFADTICLMSYKDTAEAIWNLGANAYAAAVKNNCKVVWGIETGDYSSGKPPHNATFNSPNDEFAQETKEIAYTELGTIYFELSERLQGTKYGIAIHQHEDWYNLQKNSQ